MCLKAVWVTTFYLSDGKAHSQGPAKTITPLPSVAWSKQVHVHLSQSQDVPLDFPFSAWLPLLSWQLCNIYSVLLISGTVGMFQHLSLSLNKTFKSCGFLVPHILKGINLLHKENFFVRRRTKHMTKFPFTWINISCLHIQGLDFFEAFFYHCYRSPAIKWEKQKHLQWVQWKILSLGKSLTNNWNAGSSFVCLPAHTVLHIMDQLCTLQIEMSNSSNI